jgi:hypothetical protein
MKDKMASLLHEVWEDSDNFSQMVCLAGIDGDKWRATLGQNSRLVATFEASSYGEAMNKYYGLYDLGQYKPYDSTAFEPYPEEWKSRQLNTLWF